MKIFECCSVILVCSLMICSFFCMFIYIKHEQGMDKEFYTDTNGCQYFRYTKMPRNNPNGTQMCNQYGQINTNTPR